MQLELVFKFCYFVVVWLQYQFEYVGVQCYEFKFCLVWVLQWGCWCISMFGGNGLFGFGGEVCGDGVSIELVCSDWLKFGFLFWVDSGCSSGDVLMMFGLFDVWCMLCGCIYVGYVFIKDWQVFGFLFQDLLGW